MSIVLERAATRRCVRIFDDNYEYLALVARSNGVSRDALIRNIIDVHCKNLRSRETQALQLVEVLDPNLNDLCDLELGVK